MYHHKKNSEKCSECENSATHSGGYGEPLCISCWKDAGMYDANQGFEPSDEDWNEYNKS